MDVNVYLFDGFETLDAFGPVEVLGRVEEYNIILCSQSGGIVESAQGGQILTKPVDEAASGAVFVIPGGMGTRRLVQDEMALESVRRQALDCEFCLSVCTGSAVLAKCGVLDGKRATSNKLAMEWVKSNGENVIWVDRARWCVDGKYYTASGVSAGIDMALGFVAERFGQSFAEQAARKMEYVWNSNPDNDLFAKA